MSDIIQRIEHPAVEEMRAKYEVEIAELRQELQEQIDDRDEQISNAESSVYSQTDFLKELKLDKEGKKRASISFEELKDKLGSHRLARWEEDWNVLDDVYDILRMVEVKTEIEYREIIREKEVMPTDLRINGKDYIIKGLLTSKTK